MPASVAREDPEQRALEASTALPPHGGVTGWAALRWMGGGWFDGATPDGGLLPVTLAVSGHRVRPRPGVAASQERLRPDELIEVDGVWLTTAVRSVLFAVRYARHLLEAVIVVDMACFSDLVSIAELEDALPMLAAWTGVEQARQAVALAHENAWSPPEVSLRLLCDVEAGIPGMRCNAPVFDLRGRHVGTPDLLDPASGLAIEYDGGLHLAADRRAVDLRRARAFREIGIELVAVVSRDLRDRGRTVDLIRTERERAAGRREGVPRWTLEAPPWWVPTETVEQRRRLTGAQARRLLAHRHAS